MRQKWIFRGQKSGQKLEKVDGESGKTRKKSGKSQGILCQIFGRHPGIKQHHKIIFEHTIDIFDGWTERLVHS